MQRDLHAFPTRRSSDLPRASTAARASARGARQRDDQRGDCTASVSRRHKFWYGCEDSSEDDKVMRSEEHTSELQSPVQLVCRLLLEKKNTVLNPSPRQT